MGKIILITEKPSVAQEYKKVLDVKAKSGTNGYIEGYSDFLKSDIQITWAVGHLISLGSVDEQKEQKILPKTYKSSPWRMENLPIYPEKWFYKENYATKEQFKVIKSLYTQKDVDCIYYAGDSGREGIYIQALIRNQIFKTNPKCEEKVVWIDSYTDESIKKGIKEAKPYSEYANMVEAGYQRAKTDWLIGMNFSPAYTLANHYRNNVKVIAVGRVMMPTLDLVVKRQAEIDNFKPTDFYTIKANCEGEPQWKAVKGSKYFESDKLYNETGFLKEADAKALVDDFNKDMHLTIKDIKVTKKTELAPLLFNLAELQNHCSKTYKISPNKTLEVAQSLYEKKVTTYPRTDARVLSSAVAKEIELKTGKKVPSKYVDDSKITDHYAIIPTGKKATLTDLEQKVFDDICKRYEAIFMPPYVYNSVSVVYEHQNKEQFFLNGKNDLQMGWKDLYGEKPVKFDVTLKPGDIVDVKSYDIGKSQTKAPTPYTTGTLILAMEKAGKLIEDEELREQIKSCGIGTSATRAAIIEKLNKDGYMDIDKSQKIKPTEVGKQIDKVIATFDDKILSPEKTAEMEQKLSDVANGTMSKADYEKYVHNYIDDIIGTLGADVKKNVSNSVTQTTTSDNTSATPSIPKPSKTYKCPKCNKANLKFGRYGWYCDCGFSFKIEQNGITMHESDLEALLTKGQTSVYEFTWKSGKKGKACIVLDKTNQYGTKYQFEN